jgi:hypothetical protein
VDSRAALMRRHIIGVRVVRSQFLHGCATNRGLPRPQPNAQLPLARVAIIVPTRCLDNLRLRSRAQSHITSYASTTLCVARGRLSEVRSPGNHGMIYFAWVRKLSLPDDFLANRDQPKDNLRDRLSMHEAQAWLSSSSTRRPRRG